MGRRAQIGRIGEMRPALPRREIASVQKSSKSHVDAYFEMLASAGFSGDFAHDEGTRAVYATDNSVYYVPPGGVIFPKCTDDVIKAVACVREIAGTISLTARGAATGTNGQSLTTGVAVDFARHMSNILHFEETARTITVQPGVVLDTLNSFLKRYGLFFPPTVSTASRATLGGMVATDASGKGSRIYGKTSDYVESMDIVLSDATLHHAKRISLAEVQAYAEGTGITSNIYKEVLRIAREKRDLIWERFPDLNRGLTGYNLKGMIADDDNVNLNKLLAGSEGTLALTTAITLRVQPLPRLRSLAVLAYSEFNTGLRHVTQLLGTEPAAIEILDDKVISRAQEDTLWPAVENALGGGAGREKIQAVSFVEFVGDDSVSLAEQVQSVMRMSEDPRNGIVHASATDDETVISSLWELRKKSVGLLGRPSSKGQGIAFVEDTAVPPERLFEFITAFRAILDRHGLSYGMFGHADVGCLHVRPVLDMTEPRHRDLVREISDEVAQLCKSYGGLLWGEHGRGFRGEYSPFFFGEVLFDELCQLKNAFDPGNVLNPGKLAWPSNAHDNRSVDKIDEVPFRGARDAKVDAGVARDFGGAMACNGNGACHNFDYNDPMCPSYKATRDRTQSPKGRASLLREWALLQSTAADTGRRRAIEDALDRSLSTCLSCKACATQCPVQVDIPTMKSRYLESRYANRRRPLRDHVVASVESLGGIGSHVPRLANLVAGAKPVKWLFERFIGLTDLPPLALQSPDSVVFGYSRRRESGPGGRSVILLQDSFTSRFDARVPIAAFGLLDALGYTIHMPPLRKNGKALHVLGMRKRFARVAREAVRNVEELAASGVPIVAIEPATALMFGGEYREFTTGILPVQKIELFLASEIAQGNLRPPDLSWFKGDVAVFTHCTETTASPQVGENWSKVLAAFGLTASFPKTGCCGMSGMFGHETEHQAMSRNIFDASWGKALDSKKDSVKLATGFSCRCQAKRFSRHSVRHPLEFLYDKM